MKKGGRLTCTITGPRRRSSRSCECAVVDPFSVFCTCYFVRACELHADRETETVGGRVNGVGAYPVSRKKGVDAYPVHGCLR